MALASEKDGSGQNGWGLGGREDPFMMMQIKEW